MPSMLNTADGCQWPHICCRPWWPRGSSHPDHPGPNKILSSTGKKEKIFSSFRKSEGILGLMAEEQQMPINDRKLRKKYMGVCILIRMMRTIRITFQIRVTRQFLREIGKKMSCSSFLSESPGRTNMATEVWFPLPSMDLLGAMC